MKLSEKTLKKFLALLDKGQDIQACLDKFPDEREKLMEYVNLINSFKNLENIKPGEEIENKSLKNIYSRGRIDSAENMQKMTKKDRLLIRLRPAYLKPLTIFLGTLFFMSFSFGGTLYASSSSVPGDTLYAFKRTSENIHVSITPQKYKGRLYIKLLEKRLSEADIILSEADYTNTEAANLLLSDIDNTYRQCLQKKYLDNSLDSRMQMRIRGVKEGFKNKCGMQGSNSTICPEGNQSPGTGNDPTTGTGAGNQAQCKNNQGNCGTASTSNSSAITSTTSTSNSSNTSSKGAANNGATSCSTGAESCSSSQWEGTQQQSGSKNQNGKK